MITSKIFAFVSVFANAFGQPQPRWQNDELCGNATDLLSGPGLIQQVSIDVPWTATLTARSELQPDTTYAVLIISPTMILSGANTFIAKDTTRFHFLNYSQYFVTVGGTRKFGDPVHLKDDNAQKALISHISIHPKFQPSYWATRKSDLALIHLKSPLKMTDNVRPICLPNDCKLLEEIEQPGGDNLVVSGWNRHIAQNIFLRMSIQPRDNCEKLWRNNDETNMGEYVDRFCAIVGKENNHTTCIHRDVAAARAINGRYYLTGIVNNFYSLNKSRICYPDSLYYFNSYVNDDTYQWISNSSRCGPNNFTCHNGECVQLSAVCNRNKECPDGSDEDAAFCRGLNFCKEDQFACGVYGRCIPKERVNDGVEDCEEGEDEWEESNARVWIWSSSAGVVVTIALLGLCTYIYMLKVRIRNLTDEEVQEFMQGASLAKTLDPEGLDKDLIDFDHLYVNDPIQSLPWKGEYEIPSKLLDIQEEINSGNFGIVFKAQLRNNDVKDIYANGRVDVAVKTHKSSVGVQEFKALLCELKILAYVGTHENVVSFIGACTENIKKRCVYLVVEYCPLGDLRNYLIANRNGFVDLLNPKNPCPQPQHSKVTSKELLKWCSQIAKGMEYLGTKKVVHGDLAARNILLSPEMNAKISDFGLSRQLGGSGVYVKATYEPIPFKWLALESLQNKTFSEMSDVWSYGVTIWEIFSLGEMPYPGKNWDFDFINELVLGKRLPQPDYATKEIYIVMQSCWNHHALSRPSFSELWKIFAEISARQFLYGNLLTV